MRLSYNLNTESRRHGGFLLRKETGMRKETDGRKETGVGIAEKATTSRRKPLCLCVSVFCLCLSLCLSSCDRRELTYYMESEIGVLADWSASGLDEGEAGHGATTMFFSDADGSHHTSLLMSTREYEEVRLPEGGFHAVIFNRSPEGFGNVTFRGDTYETMQACARQVETRTDPETRAVTRVIVSTPEDLASDVIEGYTVTEAMLGNYSTEEYRNNKRNLLLSRNAGDKDAESGGNYTRGGDTRAEETDPERYLVRLAPLKLTQRIRVKAIVEGVNNVRSAVGLLEGVSEGVSLSTGQPIPGTVTQQFTMADIKYDEGSPFNGTLSGEFNVFGFDRSAPHKLTLKTLLVDNKTVVNQTFDVTARDVAEQDGTLTLYIEIASEKLPDVKPEGDPDSGFDATVDEWGDPIESDIPMN